MSAFIAVVVLAVITALLGMASYLYQKRTDRQVELSKQQRLAYELYMQSYHDWTLTKAGSKEEKEADNKYWRAYYALFPLASDDFLRDAMAYHSFMKEQYPDFTKEENRSTFKQLWTNLVLQMRKDAEIKSQITEDELQGHIPWYWSDYESIQGGNVDTSATSSSQQRGAYRKSEEQRN